MSLFNIAGRNVRWLSYRLLMRMQQRLRRRPNAVMPDRKTVSSTPTQQPTLWLFVSTIGELNACSTFIDDLAQSYHLVLVTDRFFYADSYLARYPQATVIGLNEGVSLTDALAAMPPKAFIICEIPCLPHDAPCRLPYEIARCIKQSGDVPMYLINGWAYQYAPSCRQDAIERWLFERDYLQMFDKLLVQTETVKQYLVAKGAPDTHVVAVGNMKFDAMIAEPPVLSCSVSQYLLTAYQATSSPVVVAGCVTDIWEYDVVVAAIAEFAKQNPEALFVIAPRHPEKQTQLDGLGKLLHQADLCFQYKSALTVNSPLPNVLVLDTLGELRAFYAIADICYVGVDHNVLEPLAFDKPVTVIEGWNTTYPSYPVFEVLMHKQVLYSAGSAKALARLWHMHLHDQMHGASPSLDALRGATALTKQHLNL